MQRLRSTYSLLNESPRAPKDDSHKHLEQFSWAQILSPESSTSHQAEERGDVQNGSTESEEQHDCTDTTDPGTGIRNEDAGEHRSDELSIEKGDVVVERWGERQLEKPSSEETSSLSPLSSDISSFGESEVSYGGLGPAARRRQVQKHHEEASLLSFDVSSNYESEASYDVLDRPLPTRQTQTSREEHYSERAHQLPFDISFYEDEASHDNGGLLDRPLQTSDTRQRQRRISREEHYSESPFDSYESEASYYFGAYLDGHPLQRDVSMTLPCPMVNPHGSASILLRHLVRVDVTPGGAVCVHHIPGNSVVTTSSTGDKTCVFHPNSRVFQDGPMIHVMTYDSRIAKICEKGVVFAPSTTRSRLAYRLDESGTKTTVDRFFDMRDILVPMGVFCDELGDRSLERCHAMVESAAHRALSNGDDVWTIGDAQIKQDFYGNVEVSVRNSRGHVGGDVRGRVDDSRRHIDGDSRGHADEDYRRHIISVLPVSGEVSVKTPQFSAKCGCYATHYLNVQMGSRKVAAGTGGLTAIHGSQKAGLDHNGKVVIF